MQDKAVSTEDLFLPPTLDLCRLECSVFHCLVESKVDAMQREKRKFSSAFSSPKKALIKRLRITSTSTVSSKEDEEKEESQSQGYKRRRLRRQATSEDFSGKESLCSSKVSVVALPSHQALHGCVVTSPRHPQRALSWDRQPSAASDEEPYDLVEGKSLCMAARLEAAPHHRGCCLHDAQPPPAEHLLMKGGHCLADYPLPDHYYSAGDREAMLSEEGRRRRRHRRRGRRKRQHAMRHLAAPISPVPSSRRKDPPPCNDELSKRARWAVVATACVLLSMCLLLVGVTLRMAPIIDDMSECD